MPLPTFDVVISPLFELLAGNPAGLRRGEAVERLASEFSLTEEERNATMGGSGKLAFMNIVDWAHGKLKWAGLSSAPSRGRWQLTAEGMTRHAEGPLTSDELAELVRGRVGAAPARDAEAEARADAQPATPDARIREAVKEIRADVELGVLERAAQLRPAAFERLVIQLLVAMGYAARGDWQHTGRPGDGGVDGIILMDRLGLDRIYIQAKRLSPRTSLSPDDVRAFFGALQRRRAPRGVLCTSGRVTDGMRAEAEHMGNVRLIAGDELARLMVEFGLGAQTEQLRLPRLDEGFFEDFGLGGAE
ncbi:MAG TPA: restriction endonuclease [Kofleriaceae bacterium]